MFKAGCYPALNHARKFRRAAMPVSKESARIRRMFGGIAARYDILNHILSLNFDRLWRRRAARAVPLAPRDRVLDLCTGTGDLAFALSRRMPRDGTGSVTGVDFSREMVSLAEAKRRRSGLSRVDFVVADALHLPFRDETFDALTVAFGIRNLADLDAGFREMRRVLRPGGRCAILEFSMPRVPLLHHAYRWYFRRVLPRVARWISRSRDGAEAYAYLPESVEEFLPPRALGARLEAAGFAGFECDPLTGGVAVLYLARRAQAAAPASLAAHSRAGVPREGAP